MTDNAATTPAHLKEDTGPKSKGHLPKSFAGIDVLADPSHRKRVVGGKYYKLGRKKVSVSRLTNAQAGKLRKNFGYWQSQTKNLTFEDMKYLKDVPIMHATGDHSKCSSEWCHARRLQEEGKTYNRKYMFSSPKDDREIA